MSLGRMMQMALADVAGMANPMFTGDPFQALDFQFGFAEAGISIDFAGNISAFNSDGPIGVIGTWDGGGSFVKSDYDFRADKTGGFSNLDGPNLQGIWYAGSGAISFKVSGTFDVDSWTGTLRMRPTGGGADIDTSPLMHLEAEGI